MLNPSSDKRHQSHQPRPVPPIRPHSDECCRSGCEPCIFQLYQQALERYRAELLAWEQERQRKKPP